MPKAESPRKLWAAQHALASDGFGWFSQKITHVNGLIIVTPALQYRPPRLDIDSEIVNGCPLL
jgi:hypothetical protein